MLKLYGGPMKSLLLILTLMFTLPSFAGVELPKEAVKKIDLKALAGVYKNSLGYETLVTVTNTSKQGDLFEEDSYAIDFGTIKRGDFFDKGEFYIEKDDIEFWQVRDNGDIVF